MSMLEDIFWYLEIKHSAFTFPAKLLQQYERTGGRFAFLSWIISALLNNKKHRRTYVFIGAKYKALIRGLPRQDVLVVGGIRQAIFSLLFRIPFLSQASFYREVVRCYEQRDEARLEKVRDELSTMLRGCAPKYVIVASDSLPMERLWIEAARSLSIKTICIQHGLFSKRNAAINDGKFADAMFVFDGHQKDVIELSCHGELRIFGYHSDVSNRSKLESSLVPKVCILGQPWAEYYRDKERRYLDYLERLVRVLDAQQIDFVYKPHPSEGGACYLQEVYLSGRVYRKTLEDAFKEYDCFISLTSTALLEATLNGKVALQVLDEYFDDERYEEYGYSRTISISDLDSLPQLIVAKPPELDSVKEMVSGTVVERFFVALRNL